VSSEVELSARTVSQASARTARGTRLPHPTGHRVLYVPHAEPESLAVARPQADSRAISTLNVTVAVLLLFFSAPLIAVAALSVWLTTRGPVLYSQIRVGVDRRTGSRGAGHRRRVDLGGRPILIYKFRTMSVDSGHARQVWTSPNDRRVTRVGKILRAFRIDELPQLVNVLRREMNVVGPRPEQPEIFSRLREKHASFPGRQRVLPGITGLAQVQCGYGGDDFQMRRKLECDLEYVERRSTCLDMRVMLRTIPVVLLRKGAR